MRLIRNPVSARARARRAFASRPLSSAASSRGSLTFPISTVGYREYTRPAIRVQRPSEEDPQPGGELSIRRVAGQSIRFKGSGIGIETEIPRRRRAAGFGWSAAPSPCPGITPKSLLRRVLRPLCARKPHKLRPEGRDRKLGGEQVREFHRTHTKRVCTCMRALSEGSPSRPSTCLLRKPVHPGCEEGCSRARDTGYYISIISALDAPEYVAALSRTPGQFSVPPYTESLFIPCRNLGPTLTMQISLNLENPDG